MDSRTASIALAVIALISLVLMIVSAALGDGLMYKEREGYTLECGIFSACQSDYPFARVTDDFCDSLQHLRRSMKAMNIIGIVVIAYCLIMHALQAAGLGDKLPQIMKTIARYLRSAAAFVALTCGICVILWLVVPWGDECLNPSHNSEEKPTIKGQGFSFGKSAWICITVFVLEVVACILSSKETDDSPSRNSSVYREMNRV
eukprot:TRINITY_DN1386_c0_g1_i2.p1 TRINITY_DN1386_c0_g1~~TRINITY_DN1386_c0_g1_i2.p1  ORF type:complete len:223 (+),score=46.25 TRINITY_DN1386_c0_g1_i2:62-670(+)